MSEKFTFFWGKGTPFSQWKKSSFVHEGITYNCAEQFMMYQKAKLFEDKVSMKAILETKDPKEQQEYGRKVSNFDFNLWDLCNEAIVYAGNYCKFTQNPELLKALLATKGTTLVEASPVDTIWGIGLAEDDPLALDRANWRGQNRLGKTLTRLREDIIDERACI